MSGIVNLVAKVDSGKYKTIKQVAELVGRDPSTIRHAIRDEKVRLPGSDEVYEGPTHKMLLGDGTSGAFVWLYTDEDIKILKMHFIKASGPRPRPAKKREKV
ncbi:hypothetical protein GCM10010423_65520 [Streptomyces levis]|uniref:Uncharacterized protein n=1 Tax=Streptomyces levis TaxID=285566 RepID=A0ABN3P3T2_9ACTN